MFYPILRPILFQADAETAHDRLMAALRVIPTGPLALCYGAQVPALPRRVMGIEFPNPVGLAAGLDKNGACIPAFAALGFGFLEIGTVTPRPQTGNPKPRIFRIPEANALINRMGFNNAGIAALVENVQRAHYRGILGINIGKNADTPIEQAEEDYRICLRQAYPFASYVTVNISSPNTKGLRDLQYGTALERLLEALKEEQARLTTTYGRYVPLALKIAPDMTEADVTTAAHTVLRHEIDAVIATNTTFSRTGVEQFPVATEVGGLSGAPLRARATQVVAQLHAVLGSNTPIIAAGGILSGADAVEKLQAGAQLVQLYTGLVYRGPGLVGEVVRTLKQHVGVD